MTAGSHFATTASTGRQSSPVSDPGLLQIVVSLLEPGLPRHPAGTSAREATTTDLSTGGLGRRLSIAGLCETG